MKYFIDTEFIEGFHKPLFGKKRHFIDLISIGIVAEDGRTYYAISKEFKAKDADQWVKDNVISKLPRRMVSFYDSPTEKANSLLWKSNKQIAEEICLFVYPTISYQFRKNGQEFLSRAKEYGWIAPQPEFYGYYADYDWVLFCSLFGRMIDLPKGFPMYCRDLKQSLDSQSLSAIAMQTMGENHSLEDGLKFIKGMESYPKQENEHNALDDAKWNMDLYKFLTASPK
jgi:hypothetical protein